MHVIKIAPSDCRVRNSQTLDRSRKQIHSQAIIQIVERIRIPPRVLVFIDKVFCSLGVLLISRMSVSDCANVCNLTMPAKDIPRLGTLIIVTGLPSESFARSYLPLTSGQSFSRSC